MASTASEAPAQVRIDYASILTGRQKAFILAGVLLGLFLAALDQTIVATALPRIVADLNGLSLYAWTSTSYLLASTTMIPIYGKLSDIYGRKVIVLGGIVGFLLGSILCGLSQTMLQLVIFRGVQGLGAAALTSTAFAIPADLFVPSERARYQGIFGAVFGLSSVIGPYLGGLLTDVYSWHWVFFVNIPFGILAFFFILFQMPRLQSGIKSTVDWLGAGLLTISVIPFLLALTLDKTTYPWLSPMILGLFAVSIVGTATFLFQQSRSPAPVIPLQLFRIRTYALAIPISMMTGAAFFAAILFLSIYLVNVLGVSATDAGTALIPLMGGFVLTSLVASQVVQRTGRYKLMVLAGIVVMLIGFWWLTTITTETSLNWIRLRMVVVGLGLGPVMPILNLALQNAVPFEVVGAATASRQFFQQLGQTIGSAIFGVILTSVLTSSMAASMEPIRASLPAELASQFDPSQMGGASGGEGAALSDGVNVSEQIEQTIHQRFEEQRGLIELAIMQDDPQAIETLLANPQAPEALRALLEGGGVQTVVTRRLDLSKSEISTALDTGDTATIAEIAGSETTPPGISYILLSLSAEDLKDATTVNRLKTLIGAAIDQSKPQLVQRARTQAVRQINTTLDTAEETAQAQGAEIGAQVDQAVKQSFVDAVTAVYWCAIPLGILAFILMLFVPELPLRTSNTSESVMVME